MPPHKVEDNECPSLREEVQAIRDKVENSYILDQENIDKTLLALDFWLKSEPV